MIRIKSLSSLFKTPEVFKHINAISISEQRELLSWIGYLLGKDIISPNEIISNKNAIIADSIDEKFITIKLHRDSILTLPIYMFDVMESNIKKTIVDAKVDSTIDFNTYTSTYYIRFKMEDEDKFYGMSINTYSTKESAELALVKHNTGEKCFAHLFDKGIYHICTNE